MWKTNAIGDLKKSHAVLNTILLTKVGIQTALCSVDRIARQSLKQHYFREGIFYEFRIILCVQSSIIFNPKTYMV